MLTYIRIYLNMTVTLLQESANYSALSNTPKCIRIALFFGGGGGPQTPH